MLRQLKLYPTTFGEFVIVRNYALLPRFGLWKKIHRIEYIVLWSKAIWNWR